MISIGTPIRVSGADRFALAGPVVKDQVGNLLILTSRELLCRGTRLESLGEVGGLSVGGRPTAYFPLEGSEKSVAQLVGWFAPTVRLDGRNLTGKIANNSYELLSSDVRIPAIGKGVVGYISGLDCYARFKPSGTGPSVVTEGLLRVTLTAKTVRTKDNAVAGSVVTLRDRSLVGIVVGIEDADLLIAPILEVLSPEGLELATAEDIRAYNEKTKSRRRATRREYPDAISKIAAALGAADSFPEDWSSMLQQWATIGWRLHQRNDPEAFAPYQSLFGGVTSPGDFAEKLWLFGLTELEGYSTGGRGWEEVLGHVFTSIALDPKTDFQDTSAASFSVQLNANMSGQSSHDLVVRYKAA